MPPPACELFVGSLGAQVNVPPRMKPVSTEMEDADILRLLVKPGWAPACCGRLSSSRAWPSKPWVLVLRSHLHVPAWIEVPPALEALYEVVLLRQRRAVGDLPYLTDHGGYSPSPFPVRRERIQAHYAGIDAPPTIGSACLHPHYWLTMHKWRSVSGTSPVISSRGCLHVEEG